MVDLFFLKAHPVTARIIDILTSLFFGLGIMLGVSMVMATLVLLVTTFSLGLVVAIVFALVYAWILGEAVRS